MPLCLVLVHLAIPPLQFIEPAVAMAYDGEIREPTGTGIREPRIVVVRNLEAESGESFHVVPLKVPLAQGS